MPKITLSKKPPERFFYRGNEVFGNYRYSPGDMRAILLEYERVLLNGQYDRAREMEREEGAYPTMLNLVIFDVCSDFLRKDNNEGLVSKIVGEFKDRGFSMKNFDRGKV